MTDPPPLALSRAPQEQKLLGRLYELVVGAQIRLTRRARERDLQEARDLLEQSFRDSAPVSQESARPSIVEIDVLSDLKDYNPMDVLTNPPKFPTLKTEGEESARPLDLDALAIKIVAQVYAMKGDAPLTIERTVRAMLAVEIEPLYDQIVHLTLFNR